MARYFPQGPDGHHEADDRLVGYKRALEVNGIEYDERYVFPGNFRRDSGHLAVENLLGTPNLTADAIVASNDETAIGALNELKKHNLLAPYSIMASIGSVILESATKECLEAAVLSADSVLYEEKIEKKKKGISRR